MKLGEAKFVPVKAKNEFEERNPKKNPKNSNPKKISLITLCYVLANKWFECARNANMHISHSSCIRYGQILSDIVRYCYILSDIVQYCLILSDIV
jgi:hypothetical protein